MEPLNAVIDLKADACTVWCGSQFQTIDQLAIATAPAEARAVTLNTMQAVAGSAARKPLVRLPGEASTSPSDEAGRHRCAGEDHLVARGRYRGGYYRPLFVHRVVAGLDAGNALRAWNHTIVGQSILKERPSRSTWSRRRDSSAPKAWSIRPIACQLQVSVHHRKSTCRCCGGVPSATRTPRSSWRRWSTSWPALQAGPIAYRLALLDPSTRGCAACCNSCATSRAGRAPSQGTRSRGGGARVVRVDRRACRRGVRRQEHDPRPQVTSAIDCGFAVNPLTSRRRFSRDGLRPVGSTAWPDHDEGWRRAAEQLCDYPVLRLPKCRRSACTSFRARPIRRGWRTRTPPIAPPSQTRSLR